MVFTLLIILFDEAAYQVCFFPNKRSLENLQDYIKVAIPNYLVVGIDYWSLEILTLMAGYFTRSYFIAQTVVGNTVILLFLLPVSLNISITTLIGTAIGKN